MKKDTRTSAENPYLAAEQKWMERYGTYIQAAYHWRLIGVLSLLAAIVATVGLIMVANRSQVVPYVVQVDKLGQAVAISRADVVTKYDQVVTRAQLARWITAVRSVYSDPVAQRIFVMEAYSMINKKGAAFVILNDYMRANEPFKRMQTEAVSVEVQNVSLLTTNTWRIEWREEVRGLDGTVASTTQYQANVTVSFSPPTDDGTIRANPTGLYINNFNWAPRT